jgi:hypothetical protein
MNTAIVLAATGSNHMSDGRNREALWSDRRCALKSILIFDQTRIQSRECLPHERRCDYLSQSVPEVSCHVANEAMNRHFRDAMADDRVHGSSDGAERWFVNAGEI